ncbi:MAG: PLDc N-terminal domain-containing protein [Bradymonadaceae bacterium]|nr:PLDc N-terminal domain-containing protein [Lujinxingiaceae bacterium]
MFETLDQFMPVLLSVMAVSAAALTSVHVLLSRREPGSAVAWIGLAWLAPFVGVTLYLILGVNRIRRRAETLRRVIEPFFTLPTVTPLTPESLEQWLPEPTRHLSALAHVVNEVVRRPLLPGARIEPLFDGDEVFPAMIDAIEKAQKSITLASYIFDNDAWGQHFVRALAAAVTRGVEVRVLIDAAGLRYSFPTILRALRRAKVRHTRFLPSIVPPHFMTINLRNHRKIMVVDGTIGFTGGINIRAAHVLASKPRFPTHDLHFRLEGPVVAHLQEVFADDWAFSARELLRGELWFPPLEPVGSAIARGIPDGPDEDFDKLRWTLLGALACARHHVRIVTPYFVPDTTLMTSINLAVMRGVVVDIVLPAVNNLPFVHWAAMSQLRPLLERGCTIWFTPPPFDHSKLMIVDSQWVLLGSANWDERSLRLNFEFNVECYDEELAGLLEARIEARLLTTRPYTLQDYEKRSTLVRLRDGAAALLAPYL